MLVPIYTGLGYVPSIQSKNKLNIAQSDSRNLYLMMQKSIATSDLQYQETVLFI